MTPLARASRAGIPALALLAAGCGRPASSKFVTVGATVGAPATIATAPASSATDAARDFVAALDAGMLTPERLTPEFRAAVAPGAFSDAHAAEIAADWLAQFRGKLSGPSPSLLASVGTTPGAGMFVGTAGGRPVAVRVTGRGPFALDFFAAGPPGGPKFAAGGGPAGFTAQAFAAALAGGDDALAAALMAPELKASLAPPFDSDKAKGYNAGLLKTRLAELRGGGGMIEVMAFEGESARVKLPGGKAATLRLAPGARPFERLVSAIEAGK